MNEYETANAAPAPSWIRHLVVAADGSAASKNGLELAADVARRTEARISVVLVRHVPVGAYMDLGANGEPIAETLAEQEAEVRTDAATVLDGTGIEWEFVVLQGSPGEELVRFVSQVSADLVVVGSNRHSSLHNLLLGSTSAYLTAHSPAPVLVARPRGGSQATPEAATSGARAGFDSSL